MALDEGGDLQIKLIPRIFPWAASASRFARSPHDGAADCHAGVIEHEERAEALDARNWDAGDKTFEGEDGHHVFGLTMDLTVVFAVIARGAKLAKNSVLRPEVSRNFDVRKL